MTITKNDVEAAFRLILAREPESQATIDYFLGCCASLDELRTQLINSAEFRAMLGGDTGRPDTALIDDRKNQLVEFDAAPAQLLKLWAQVGRSWETLGQGQPFNSVVTADEFLSENFDTHETEFWKTGSHDTDKILNICESCGIDLGPLKVALEYGCGVGRASMYLSSLFDKVHSLDISRYHLDIAKQRAAQLHLNNIDFKLVETTSFDHLPEFDFVYSRLVLQHNPPPIMSFILSGLLQKLNPGGVGIFQIPVYMSGYSFNTTRYLKSTPPDLDMHCLPQSHIFDLVKQAGCTLRELREDGDIGNLGEWVSNTITVRKS